MNRLQSQRASLVIMEPSIGKTGKESVTAAILHAAVNLADMIDAEHILILAGGKVSKQLLSEISEGRKIVLAVPTKQLERSYRNAGYSVMQHVSLPLDRFSRISHAVLAGISHKLIDYKSRVVSASGPLESEILDSIIVMRTEQLFRELTALEKEAGDRRALMPVIRTVIDIAVELGSYGMEGRPVGTMFIVGDTASVLRLSRQATFNPFRGYSEKQRNILDPEVRDSVKGFAQIDGAFVIREDGVINSAGRLLMVPKGTVPLLRGMGARHNAAALITGQTSAVAIVVSQTTGNVSLFSKGRLLLTFSTVRRTEDSSFAQQSPAKPENDEKLNNEDNGRK